MCKGRLESRGGGGGGEGVVYVKDINHLAKIDHFARWSFLLYITCINKYNILYSDKCIVRIIFTVVALGPVTC